MDDFSVNGSNTKDNCEKISAYDVPKLAFSIMIRRWTNQTTATKLQMFRYHCCICLFAAFCVWILMNSGPTFPDEKSSTVGKPQSTFKIINLYLMNVT